MTSHEIESICHGWFTCFICTCFEAGPYRYSDNRCFCIECTEDQLKPILLEAVKYEVRFPPKAGDIYLNYRDFLDILPEGYEDQYHHMEVESETPPDERLYCLNCPRKGDVCGKFLGTRNVESNKQCSTCNAHICGKCGGPTESDNLAHKCPNRPQDEASGEECMQESKEKGISFQLCPVCKCAVFLGDGCNHMVCPSHNCAKQNNGNQVNFCYLCGEMVDGGDSGHWSAGKPCPRFGRPDHGRPIWDVGAIEEEQAEEEDELVESDMEMIDVVYGGLDGTDDTLVDDELLVLRGHELILFTRASVGQQLDWNRARYNAMKTTFENAMLEMPLLLQLSERDQNDLFVQEARLSMAEGTLMQFRNHLERDVTQAVINSIFALGVITLFNIFYRNGIMISRGHEASLDILAVEGSLQILALDWPVIPDATMNLMTALSSSKQYVDSNNIHQFLEDMKQEDNRLEALREEWERMELELLRSE